MTLIRWLPALLASPVLAATLTVGTGGLCNGVATTYNETQLQTAINAAVAGDEIVLCAGMTITAPAKAAELDNDLTGWVTMRSSRSGELLPGYRVFPSDASKMAKICNTSKTDPTVSTKPGAKFWRLIGLEIMPCAVGQLTSINVVQIGDSIAEQGIDKLSHDITIDRCYVHGHPFDLGPQRGILANAYRVQVINSYIDEIHPPAGVEGHGIGLWSGWHTLIRNNFISASSEHILVGGAHAPYQGLSLSSQIWIGNYLYRPAKNFTLNYEADPEGNTLPDCVPTSECVTSQTFHDLDDDIMYVRTSGSAWVVIRRYPTNGAVCQDDAIWRNLFADTLWTCVGGFWQSGGTNITLTPVTSTNVTEGATTNITVPVVGATGYFHCLDAYPNATGCTASTKGIYVTISGGTGDCTGINGRWRYTYSTTNPAGSFFIPYNSTGQTCPNALTIVRDFYWWDNKNGAEWKSVFGGRFEGNVTRNLPAHTWQGQRGAGFLKNWVPLQDGSASTISSTLIANNIFDPVTQAISEGILNVDYLLTASAITPGNPTTIVVGNTGMENNSPTKGGEEFCFTQGTGTWEGINQCWVATITGSCGSSACTFTIPFNSAGMDDTGQSIRITDNLHKKPAAWPRRHRYYNNFWNLLPAHAIHEYMFTHTGNTDGTSGATYSATLAQAYQLQYPETIVDHNTTIRQSTSPQFWTPVDVASRGFFVHKEGGRTPDATAPLNSKITNNIFDGTSATWYGIDSSAACRPVLAEMEAAGGKITMAGNAANFSAVWKPALPTTSTDYGEDVCPGYRRVWDRTGTAAPATLNSVVVSDDDTACPDTPTAQQKMVLTWAAAARLLPGSYFRLSGYTTPSSAVDGLYQIPLVNPPGTAVVTHSSTAWAVCIGNIAAATYTGGTWSSTMDFVDYAGGNYRLAPTSPFKQQATDGSDPGADFEVLGWSTEGAISGVPNAYLDTHITTITTNDTSAVICFVAYDASPATLTVSTSRVYTPDLGTDTPNQTGRNGCTTVNGLTASTRYYVRLHTAGRYKDTDTNGEFAQFTTRENAVIESEYLSSLKSGIQGIRGNATGSSVELGCHLLYAQGNGFVDTNPGVYEDLALWQAYADNLKAADCKKIVINIDLRPWIANDTTDITRYVNLFTYIKTTLALKLSLAPQATPGAKTAIQALAACPNGGLPCYDGTFNTPSDWFSGAKGAMGALAQLASTARPHDIVVVHEPTTADSFLGISGLSAQWDAVVGNFATDATYGIQTLDTTIRVGAGCRQIEVAYCALFSDRAGVDFIGLDFYDHTMMAQALSIASDALAADGTPKEFEVEETARHTWTNSASISEQSAVNGTGYDRVGAPVCYDCQWLDAVVRRFSEAGATSVCISRSQNMRYYALPGAANNNGLSVAYNNLVAATPAATLSVFGQYVLAHPLLN